MNIGQAQKAIAELMLGAKGTIGYRFGANTIDQKCTRCKAVETMKLPKPAAILAQNPANVPSGFDEKLFDWMKKFQDHHKNCGAS